MQLKSRKKLNALWLMKKQALFFAEVKTIGTRQHSHDDRSSIRETRTDRKERHTTKANGRYPSGPTESFAMYDEDMCDVGFCSRCGALLASEPPTAVHCWDCLAQDKTV